jgi:hypothetical protein
MQHDLLYFNSKKTFNVNKKNLTNINRLTTVLIPVKIMHTVGKVKPQWAELAQLVEHATENRSVRSPILRLGTLKTSMNMEVFSKV